MPSPRNPKRTRLDTLILRQDPWLEPFLPVLKLRREYINSKREALPAEGQSLEDFANGHLYYGLQETQTEWILREYAPNATGITLLSDATRWEATPEMQFTPLGKGNWQLKLPKEALRAGMHYKLLMQWCAPDGTPQQGERIPVYARRVVQDAQTGLFSAQVPQPEPPNPPRPASPKRPKELYIYEAHIGMSAEQEGISSYSAFKQHVLPRIVQAGYNAVQLMAVQEHPYYPSFGYHVANFFAPTSRFGTPAELKELIDEAHRLGLTVIMDLVHSHAVKNVAEGPAEYDGTRTLFFHSGARGENTLWDSLAFNYGSPWVLHFLLSNCKYWLQEFRFDGFRFDGVTAMLYTHHGFGKAFTQYADYFGSDVDPDALLYLTLANELIHTVNPNAVTIAEEVSGMPLLAQPIRQGGLGFDYRLSMNIPDMWIKLIKECPDEQWNTGYLFHELTNRRREEYCISYAESHDQALVGDKTIFFRLVDAAVYEHMHATDHSFVIERGIALTNMIKLATLSTAHGGYLNFMGNEFGHPEWIDFPRPGNGYSYAHARRQWSLAGDPKLKFRYLLSWDKAMIALARQYRLTTLNLQGVLTHGEEQLMVFMRGPLLFVFNFSPTQSRADYPLRHVRAGKYTLLLDSDAPEFGGQGRVDASTEHFTFIPDRSASAQEAEACPEPVLQLYLPARSCQVYLCEQ